ncbi:helix-turn-helix domain-containing protein [Sinomicrobium weinanense]|uniref:Helix-turn-helix transcriptional regulator n=1 Tax=Sinomicrobium weinanense TaxID=2842200 RepID=A0A926JVT1_9FLAO|nr:AraC family transcriptional regulator [Sinomicrobium weinanense]MBC9798081.1 helix-turn-helix transcriptional regulator [Sinomicrobium weinanense]MBU3122557.1 AraC family transcriptional regulator [Sinomicrobium weinanense]
MEQKVLYRPFELYVSDMDCWGQRPLVYHFFEIVQILEGRGSREVNNNHFPYDQGSIFLFTPLDCRGFDIEEPTRFCSIRFSEMFLGQCKTKAEKERTTEWLRQLEHIFFHHNRFRELKIRRPEDGRMISGLIHHMVEEYTHKPPLYEENLKHLVTLVLNILSRNVTDDTVAGHVQQEPLINRILLYIHEHIGNPEKLRIEHLAERFNLSANYVSEYFRKFTGESLQRYITQYKVRLVEQRLAHSPLTVSQIAGELGYTDESHLSRQFRKYNGQSPVAYRKSAGRGY